MLGSGPGPESAMVKELAHPIPCESAIYTGINKPSENRTVYHNSSPERNDNAQ